MTTPPLADRLLLTPGMRARIVNLPRSVAPLLDPLPAGVRLNETGAAPADWLLVFLRDEAAVQAFGPAVLGEVAYDGVLWCAFPSRAAKPATDIDRDHGWEPLTDAGFTVVDETAIDGCWTALRFRPKEAAGA